MPDVAYPFQQPTSTATESQKLQFFVMQRLLRVQTSIAVEVKAVHGGGVGMTGTVDVQPCINQIDGAGNSVKHGTIYGRPYSRVQGGSNAYICDPKVGDLGLMVFASRDISAFIAAAKNGSPLPVNPGSRRVFDYADGLYMFGVLNGTPTTYVELAPDGSISIVSPVSVTISAPTINLNGATVDGNGIITDGAGVVSDTHEHLDGGGIGNSGPPAT